MMGNYLGYRENADYCEACARLERMYPVLRIEVHHIEGRVSDDTWNLITLCPEHHRRGTHHDQEHGGGSKDWNNLFLAIKALKGELSEEALGRLGDKRVEEVMRRAEELAAMKAYQDGLHWGWYKG